MKKDCLGTQPSIDTDVEDVNKMEVPTDFIIYERNKKELGICGDIIDSVRKLQSELYDKMIYIRKLELEIEVLKANQRR